MGESLLIEKMQGDLFVGIELLQRRGQILLECDGVRGGRSGFVDSLGSKLAGRVAEAALDAVPAARTAWDAFPPSSRKLGISNVDMARRADTRAARVAKIVADAAEGKRP